MDMFDVLMCVANTSVDRRILGEAVVDGFHLRGDVRRSTRRAQWRELGVCVPFVSTAFFDCRSSSGGSRGG